MQLCHFGDPGEERAGVVTPAGRVDVGRFVRHFDEGFWADDGVRRLDQWFTQRSHECPRVPAEARVAAAVLTPSKIVCVGRNYREHAAETGAEPQGLGVVIGRPARYVERADALGHVAGFVLFNDVSERAFQKERGGQWENGKSADTFAPVGPYVCSADALSATDLRLWLELNGALMQDDRTSSMIFDVAMLVSYISEFMTLNPGDLISTGTPSGVGAGQKPPRYLRRGDVIRSGIEGLGESQRRVIAFER